MGPKKLFRRIAQNNEPIKDIFFVFKKKKKKLEKRKRKVNHCSSGVGSTGDTGTASSVTLAMVVASSTTFLVVALERRLDRSSFSTSPMTRPEGPNLGDASPSIS